jgi:acyl-CoA thioesterase-1
MARSSSRLTLSLGTGVAVFGVLGGAVLYVARRRRRGILGITGVLEHHRIYWRERARQDGDLLYVALGDSAAQGIGASRPDRGYVGLLARRISRRTGRRVRVVNLSVSGATTSLLVEKQLPRLARLEPDVVTVAIGANDMAAFDPRGFERSVRAIVDALPDHAIMADLPHFYIVPAERRVRLAGPILRTIAADRGLTVAPLYDTMRRQGLWAVLTQFKDDYFHPNDIGYRVWASAFHEAIDARCAALTRRWSAAEASARRAGRRSTPESTP